MSSVTQICNRALQHLGAARITDLSEDSRNARSCNAVYEIARDAELEAHPWRFAIKRVALAADSVSPAFGKERSFTLPADYMKIMPRDMGRLDIYTDWEIEGDKIFTDESAPLEIRYIGRITDVSLFPALFQEALSARIAMELSEEITQSNSKIATIAQIYKSKTDQARRANAFAKRPQVPPEDQYVRVRD